MNKHQEKAFNSIIETLSKPQFNNQFFKDNSDGFRLLAALHEDENIDISNVTDDEFYK